MPNTFRKIDHRTWGVLTGDGIARLEPGSVVTVTKRDGSLCNVTLGEYVRSEYGRNLYHCQDNPETTAAAAPAATPAPVGPSIGDMAGINTLFNNARNHLRRPAIVLSVPSNNDTVRISVAGERARVPGSLNVVSNVRADDFGRAVWYGRVHQDGRFEASNRLPAGINSSHLNEIVARLRDFATNPARVAGEHGRLTGRCCFCHHPLEDERSTAVGYGPICAGHYGLPWGDRPVTFAAPVTETSPARPMPAPMEALSTPAPLHRRSRPRRYGVMTGRWSSNAPTSTPVEQPQSTRRVTPANGDRSNPALIVEESEI